MISDNDIQQAMEAGAKFVQMVTAVRYRPKNDKIEIRTSWCTLLVDRKQIPELSRISKRRIREIYVSVNGIHIESADMDIESAGLVVYIARKLVEEAEQAVGGKFC